VDKPISKQKAKEMLLEIEKKKVDLMKQMQQGKEVNRVFEQAKMQDDLFIWHGITID